MILELAIPSPPATVIQRLVAFAQTLGHNDSSREWLRRFHNNEINVVNYDFEWAQEINEEMSSFLAPYFPKEDILTVAGIMRNVSDEPAWLPPHCDRLRYLAINFYIDLGGNNVETKFYNYNRQDGADMSEAHNLRFNDIEEIISYKFQTGRWYCYNVQQCHAVSGVETARIFLALIIKSNLTLEQFKEKYSSIIKEQLCTF